MFSPSLTDMAPDYLRRMDSPLGRIELSSDGESITSLSIEREGHLPWETAPERTADVLEAAVEQLQAYFAGERTTFDLPISLR